ncbi:MAG TPA: hypothetical protein VIQ60_06800 [Gemmatimonadaceae bacterium]|jgi:hypothetical protein
MTNPPGDLQSRAPSSDVRPLTAPTAAHEAREQLAAALLAAYHPQPREDQGHATNELRSSVTAYIAALRVDGATVEHAVISTKELLAETMGSQNIPLERRALAEQVVSWGIEAYYDSPEHAD